MRIGRDRRLKGAFVVFCLVVGAVEAYKGWRVRFDAGEAGIF
jgi:hypothetical protein